jgi:hypothetical protein
MEAVVLVKGGGSAAGGATLGMGLMRLAGAFSTLTARKGALLHFPAKAPRMKQSVVVDRVR